MFQKQSFDLVKKEPTKRTTDNMYKPRRCRCMRFVIFPALAAFVLLLILANVDFESNDHVNPNFDHSKPSKTTTQLTTLSDVNTTLQTTSRFDSMDANLNVDSTSPELLLSGNLSQIESPAARASLWCTDNGTKCNITCQGDVYDVYKSLEDQQDKCGKTLNVILKDCTFQSGVMDVYFFMSYYKVQTLHIEDCNLKGIARGAFNQSSVRNLSVLALVNTQLTELNADTFDGLQNLLEFTLVNLDTGSVFTGNNFLVRMAATLNKASIEVQSYSTPYKPDNWLAGTSFLQLTYLNLHGNRFPQTITKQSFMHLSQIRDLLLDNCSIEAIATDTFDALMPTLRYLDLRNNQLQVLSGDFLLPVELLPSFRLELGGNHWYCSCDIKTLLVAVKSPQVWSEDGAYCTAPKAWQHKSMESVILKCEEEVTTDTSEATTQMESTLILDPSVPIYSSLSTHFATSSMETEQGETTSAETETETESDASSSSDSTEEMATTSKTTIFSDTTTFTPTNCRTTPEVRKFVPIQCYPRADYCPSVRNYDALFQIQPNSSDSVTIKVEDDMHLLRYMYFSANYTEHKPNTRSLVLTARQDASTSTNVHIEGLKDNLSYVFCLIPDEDIETSPFNCRGHFLAAEASIYPQAWLFHSNKVLFIVLSTLGVIMSLVLGVSLAYLVLCFRPTWVKGSKRLQPVSHKSHKVYLLPAEREYADFDHDVECPYACSYSVNVNPKGDRIVPKQLCQCKKPEVVSNDYMRYYKKLELPGIRQNSVEYKSHAPPQQRAPSIPSHSDSGYNSFSRPISTQSAVHEKDLILRSTSFDRKQDYEYQSLEVYEEIL